jgi:prepilin-type N-terminal cleavage/methylation domain-containing protein/prepilin-type processing-associated H-X9-DG protein
MKSIHQHKGFTLTELLVVILIIVVLASLSFSVLSRMRHSADKVVVTRNLAQLQLANIAYASDHNGGFVPVREFDDKGSSYNAWFQNQDFMDNLKGYSADPLANGKVDSTLPPGMLDPAALRAKRRNYLSIAASYGYNSEGQPNTGGWSSPGSTSFFRIDQLTAPARSAAFITATDWQAKYSGRFLWKGAAAVEGGTPDGKIAYRYNKKAIVAYYDGHVGEVGTDDMKRFDQAGGIRSLFWDADAK